MTFVKLLSLDSALYLLIRLSQSWCEAVLLSQPSSRSITMTLITNIILRVLILMALAHTCLFSCSYWFPVVFYICTYIAYIHLKFKISKPNLLLSWCSFSFYSHLIERYSLCRTAQNWVFLDSSSYLFSPVSHHFPVNEPP